MSKVGFHLRVQADPVDFFLSCLLAFTHEVQNISIQGVECYLSLG